MKAKIEMATNITLMVASIVVCSALVLRVRSDKDTRQPTAFREGQQLPKVEGIDYRNHARTLLLGIRSGCHFCSESMPFYKSLFEARAKSGLDVSLVVVTSDDLDTARAYLKTNGLTADMIISDRTTLQIRATPTLILADRSGKVVQSWVGKLSETAETAVRESVVINRAS